MISNKPILALLKSIFFVCHAQHEPVCHLAMTWPLLKCQAVSLFIKETVRISILTMSTSVYKK